MKFVIMFLVMIPLITGDVEDPALGSINFPIQGPALPFIDADALECPESDFSGPVAVVWFC
ncbi:MAG: hypothetical protein ACSHWS_03970 [Sulfitobacter sp.]